MRGSVGLATDVKGVRLESASFASVPQKVSTCVLFLIFHLKTHGMDPSCFLSVAADLGPYWGTEGKVSESTRIQFQQICVTESDRIDARQEQGQWTPHLSLTALR